MYFFSIFKDFHFIIKKPIYLHHMIIYYYLENLRLKTRYTCNHELVKLFLTSLYLTPSWYCFIYWLRSILPEHTYILALKHTSWTYTLLRSILPEHITGSETYFLNIYCSETYFLNILLAQKILFEHILLRNILPEHILLRSILPEHIHCSETYFLDILLAKKHSFWTYTAQKHTSWTYTAQKHTSWTYTGSGTYFLNIYWFRSILPEQILVRNILPEHILVEKPIS